ncbi:hypothetical protein KSC_056790 [Ktedonobacter sp. SOSP1-52]|uniref:hypothetical protein n=1 Tax=Ktedonobacter sp. SOSP1-52 TaxID=2778366 RepID=UPI0019154F01|nr:hypothetical protein [Ktedonobacter sp. SOSP1-52]GHO66787.1 hypothetical protein KSC_056790 [Ktedonobacter sp. SOSP1-52]
MEQKDKALPSQQGKKRQRVDELIEQAKRNGYVFEEAEETFAEWARLDYPEPAAVLRLTSRVARRAGRPISVRPEVV